MTTAAGRVVLTFDIDDSGVVQGIGGINKQVESVAKQWKNVGRELSDIGGSMTKFITLPIIGVGAVAAKVAMDFESSFAGIVKTVDDATDSMGRLTPVGKQLQRGMRDLAKQIPINVNELNRIGESAGQLGIKSSNIVKFTDVVAKMGVTTLLSTEEAANGMARLANITSMPQENFDRLGSTIVALGNNFATTEPEILEFGLRIAGAGTSAGMAEHQILGIGTAVASVGVQAEAGGTAVQKVILDMLQATVQGGEKLEVFARTAGMAADEFRRAFEEDAAGAFNAFVTGLGKEGKHAISVLDELGLADARLIRTFLALSNASGLLTDALGVGSEAWEKNTALSREAELRFATTESRLTLLGNRARDVGITFGNALLPAITSAVKGLTSAMPVLEGLANAFAAAPAPLQLTVIGLAAVAAGIGPVLWGTGQLITSAATVASAFGATGTAAKLLNGNLITLSGTMRVAVGLLGSFGAAVAGISLRSWIEEIAESKLGVSTLNTELDALGSNASWWDKLKVIVPRLNDGMMGVSVAGTLAARALRGVGQASEDIRLPVSEGSQLIAQQQEYLQASVQGLTAAVDMMKQRGASSADVLKEWGADAANAAATAKKLGVDLSTLPAVVLELARAYESQETASQRAARAAEAKAAADARAKEAAELATRAAEAQRQALRSLGITTRADVIEAITGYNESLALAANEGSSVFRVATAEVIMKLLELRRKAIESGQSVEMIDAELKALRDTNRSLAGEYPNLNSQIMTLSESMRVLAGHTGMVTGEQVRAQTEASLLESAYKTLGIESQRSLKATADEARRAYRIIASDINATQEDLERAWEAVLEAERRTRKQGVSVWKAYADQVIGIAKGISRAFTDQIVGINSTLHDEKKRAVDQAKETFDRTQRDATESVARTEQSAREEHARTTESITQGYERQLSEAQATYQQKLAAAGTNQEAIKALEIWYAAEQQRIQEERDAARVEADRLLNDTIRAAAEESNAKIAESNAAMQAAIEEASHPWKDRMLEIWSALRSGVQEVLSTMLSDFINSFLGGMLQGLQGWAKQAGGIIGSILGMGSAVGSMPLPGMLSPGVLTAPGGGAAAAGGGVAAGGAALAVGLTAASVAPIAVPWVMAALGPHGNDARASAQMEVDALLEGLAYQGLTLEQGIAMGMTGGLSWDAQQILGLDQGGVVDAGAGGLAVLHGQELVAPLPAGFDIADLLEPSDDRGSRVGHVYLDGRELIRSLVRWLPDEADRLGAFAR